MIRMLLIIPFIAISMGKSVLAQDFPDTFASLSSSLGSGTFFSHDFYEIANTPLIQQEYSSFTEVVRGDFIRTELTNSGNIVVRANGFVITLSANGNLISRETSTVSQDLWLDPVSRLTTEFPQINSQFGNIDQHGVPAGGLESEAKKALEACIQVGQQKIREARLADQVAAEASAASLGYGSYYGATTNHSELDSFLMESGVSATDLPQARADFIREAQRRTEIRENRYRYEFEQSWYISGGQEDLMSGDIGPAERMGAQAGPWIGNAIYGAATVIPGNALAGRLGAGAAGGTVGAMSTDPAPNGYSLIS